LGHDWAGAYLIVAGLQGKQLRISTSRSHELVVTPLFDDGSIPENRDLVREAERTQPMRDE
jgi:hypothetical protein